MTDDGQLPVVGVDRLPPHPRREEGVLAGGVENTFRAGRPLVPIRRAHPNAGQAVAFPFRGDSLPSFADVDAATLRRAEEHRVELVAPHVVRVRDHGSETLLEPEVALLRAVVAAERGAGLDERPG